MFLAMLFGAALQVDLHLDTPTQLHRKKVALDGAGLESGLGEMRAGGTNVAVMVLWPPAGAGEAHLDTLLTRLEAEDARLDGVEIVRSPEAARRAANAGRVAMIVAMEGAHGIDKTGLDGLRDFHARGLSMLGLTWSVSNRFAGSSSDGGKGLTTAGRELVRAAQSAGIVVDLSHASRAATRDVCAMTIAPVIASHSNADAVFPHDRNLTDEEIRCIAASGGVIGLNFHAPFVGNPATVTQVADHADHLKAVGGPGVVGLGSDYDGMIVTPKGLEDASKLPSLWAELRRRGWTETELEMLRGENFMRAWAAAQSIAAR